jgi:hypothetical protein
MAAVCKCPNCDTDLSDSARARCGEESFGTAFVAKAVSAPATVAVYCSECQIWIECECDAAERSAHEGGQ